MLCQYFYPTFLVGEIDLGVISFNTFRRKETNLVFQKFQLMLTTDYCYFFVKLL